LIVLLLGGTRSGKSAVAERFAAGMQEPVTYVATLRADDDDEDLAARVEEHRKRRPPHWRTEEVGEGLPEALMRLEGSVLVDSLGGWVASTPRMMVSVESLCRSLTERSGDTVVVSDEVGMGVHPSSEAGRMFRDVLGSLNQAVADVADEVYLVVAGRTLALEDSRDA
jgi:adenosyl cobinamide kinase/adenosyl cobinamide phosphate guanylyltransferase